MKKKNRVFSLLLVLALLAALALPAGGGLFARIARASEAEVPELEEFDFVPGWEPLPESEEPREAPGAEELLPEHDGQSEPEEAWPEHAEQPEPEEAQTEHAEQPEPAETHSEHDGQSEAEEAHSERAEQPEPEEAHSEHAEQPEPEEAHSEYDEHPESEETQPEHGEQPESEEAHSEHGEQPESEEAQPLEVRFIDLPACLIAGVPAELSLEIEGGVAPYAVALDGEEFASEVAGSLKLTVCAGEWGERTFALTVVDAAGQRAELSVALPVSDPAPEDASEWEAALAALPMDGSWAENLLAVAATQLGYRESERNFTVSEDGELLRYTRYGDAAGEAYAPRWDAAFVRFCLDRAQVPEERFPRADSAEAWRDALGDLFLTSGAPVPGDLAFLVPEDAYPWERVAIVTRAWEGGFTALSGFDGAVRGRDFELDGGRVLGFGSLATAWRRPGSACRTS